MVCPNPAHLSRIFAMEIRISATEYIENHLYELKIFVWEKILFIFMCILIIQLMMD